MPVAQPLHLVVREIGHHQPAARREHWSRLARAANGSSAKCST